MFGAKYSRLKYWVISLTLLFVAALSYSLGKTFLNMENYDFANKLFALSFVLNFLWINTLANRIRDYRGNPWFALFASIPILNLALGLYYGFTKYKNTSSADNLETTTEDTSIEETECTHGDGNGSNLDDIDDEVYDTIADELKNSKRKEGVWLKALNSSEGDENKALMVYTQLRAKSIKDEMTKKKLEVSLADEEKNKNDVNFIRESKLQKFLNDESLSIVEYYGENEMKVKHEGNFLKNLIASSYICYRDYDEWSYR